MNMLNTTPSIRRAMVPGIRVWFIRAAIFLCGAASGFAGRGTVQTIDDRILEGDVALTNGVIRITPTNGAVANLALTNLARVRFNLPDTAIAGTPPPTNEALPRPWQSRDIGAVRAAGSINYTSNTFSLQSAGMALGHTNRDTLFFVWRSLKGDGELSARLTTNQCRAAGLMIRTSLDADAPFVALYGDVTNALTMRNRSSPGRYNFRPAGDPLERPDLELPYWLKLERSGRLVIGWRSLTDGRTWERFWQTRLETPTNALFVGMFAMSGDRSLLRGAAFDEVRFKDTRTEPGANQPERSASVVLRDGTVIVGELKSADRTSVKLKRPGREFSLSTATVARLLFEPFDTPTGGDALPHRPGLLLPRDDFLDGELRSLVNGEVKVNSVLFGLRSYTQGHQARAFILRELAPAPAAYEVKTLDGSVWRAKTARLENDALALELPGIGKVSLAAGELLELTANPKPER